MVGPIAVLTLDRLREVLSYDPVTGAWTWLRPTGRGCNIHAGDSAGNVSDLYRRIGIDGSQYKAHRLAYFYMHGRWPKGQIDHRNGVPGVDAFSNLRDATQSQNCQNKRPQSGRRFKGAYFHKRTKRWDAMIGVRGKLLFLGGFGSVEAAARAYDKAAIKHFGEFARLNFPTLEAGNEQRS